jgi:hypothetical protein
MMQTADRNFDPKSVAGLSAEARQAVNAAFDAMSTWRTETMNNSEKQINRPIRRLCCRSYSPYVGTRPDGGAFATFNPFQAYAQFVEQWQKAWASATGAWGQAGRSR